MNHRRSFIKDILVIALTVTAGSGLFSLISTKALAHPKSLAKGKDGKQMPDFPPLKAAIILYPGSTALDWVGPHMWLSMMMNSTVELVAKKKGLIESAPEGVSVNIDKTFKEALGETYDIILVPGGTIGTADAILDKETVAFVKDVGSRARYVTSVCTGSLILGAAGLLKGYKATSYFPVTHLLKSYGANFVDERVVVDRNRITGGGVTAGIDFGLELTRQIRGDDFAKISQLAMEYDPHPSLNSGSLKTAEPKVISMTKEILAPRVSRMEDAVAKTRGK